MDEYNEEQEQKSYIISSDELLYMVSQFNRLYQKETYRARLPFVPYRGQNRVLHLIADNDGLNQKELAELLDIRSASMSELLNKMERSNLIKREKDEKDKRITHVFLSEEGRELLQEGQSQDGFSEILFGELSDEEKGSLYSVLKKLCASFEAQAILNGEEDEEPLPPHLREGHRSPLPPKDGPIPPLPPNDRHIPPHRKGEH